MPSINQNRRVVLKSQSSVSVGNIFTENFAPQTGTYTDVGTASKTITSGNMNITGNGVAVTVGSNYTRLTEVVWAGNNW